MVTVGFTNIIQPLIESRNDTCMYYVIISSSHKFSYAIHISLKCYCTNKSLVKVFFCIRALTRNQFHWFPDEFIKGDNLRLV